MFTGLVQAMGHVESLTPSAVGRRLVVLAQELPAPQAGDSVSVSGVCLTQVGPVVAGRLCFDVIPETLAKTTLGEWIPGTRVNLELCVTPTTALGGHWVQGHVDGVGRVLAVEQDAGAHRVRILPEVSAFRDWLLLQGSVCVSGVSLTVARLHEDGGFSAALIPETLARTTLGRLVAGDRVNLEGDVLTKTVAHQVALQWARQRAAAPKASVVDAALLRSSGFSL